MERTVDVIATHSTIATFEQIAVKVSVGFKPVSSTIAKFTIDEYLDFSTKDEKWSGKVSSFDVDISEGK